MNMKIIGLLGIVGLGLVLFTPIGQWIETHGMLVLGGSIILLVVLWISYRLTRKETFEPLAESKKNIVELCRHANLKLGHLQTLGDGNVPVVDWGEITGFSLGYQMRTGKVDTWDVFMVEKPFPLRLFSEPQIVFIPAGEHTKLEPNQDVYIRAKSLVKYGRFLFPNTVFGTPEPLKLQKELVGYQMFIKLLEDTGEITARAIFGNSEHQMELERQKLRKIVEETKGNET